MSSPCIYKAEVALPRKEKKSNTDVSCREHHDNALPRTKPLFAEGDCLAASA